MLDNYCRSFFDLWHHLDPVAAAQFDPDSPGVTVAAFDLTGGHQHLVALRSLGFAVEELSLDELEDEVDRTLLLGAIRGLDRRFASGGPYRTNPAFWMLRLAHVLRAKPEERGMVQAIPAALQTAARTLHRPSLALVERIGFAREGYSRRYVKIAGRGRDHVRFALIAEDWPVSRRALVARLSKER